MFDLDSLPPLREVISAHNLRAEKSLGQNFLLDQNITDKIVRHIADLSGMTVFEIGPGPGGLTRSILKSGAHRVVAVEFDERSVRALQDLVKAAEGRLEVLHQDALRFDPREYADVPRGIIANLPYNIATPLLTGWLSHIHENPDTYAFMLLMFQKEVADRITAAPGTKTYGRLSVLVQWLCNVRQVYVLPPSAFTPPPKVQSCVVHFKPRVYGGGAQNPDFKSLEQVTAAAFGQRRKMIRSSMKAYMPIIEKLGIDPTLRAENLSVDTFVKIALEAGELPA